MNTGTGEKTRRPALWLIGAVFLSTLGVGAFAFAIPLVALRDNISGSLLGAVFSGYFLAKLAVSPLAGALSDKFGPKPSLLAAALFGTAVPGLALLSQGHAALYCIQFGLGLAAGAMKPVAAAAVASLTPPERRGMLFSLMNALYNLAFFLGPVMGGLLYYDRNLGPVLCFLAACMAACLLLLLYAVPSGLRTVPDAPEHPETPGRTKQEASAKRFRAGALFLAVLGRTACTACLLAFYPALLAERLHGPTWAVALLFALPGLAACLALPVCGRLADRADKDVLTIAGMAASALCLGLLGTADSVAQYTLLGAAMGLGTAVSLPASMALAADLSQRRGRVMGRLHAAAGAGFVVGPPLCGAFTQHMGDLPFSLALMGLAGLLTLLPMGAARFAAVPSFSRRPAVPAVLLLCLAAAFAAGVAAMRSGAAASPAKAPQAAAAQAAPSEQGEQNAPRSYAGVAMGNIVRLTLYGVDADTGAAASDAAFATISRLEAEFSHRNISGAIGCVNLAAGKTPQPVSKAAFDLIKRALAVCRASSGVFDITIGAVTTLPYYYREKAERDKADLVDYRKVVLDEDRRTVFLPKDGMALDLGGLAKGTILDAAAATLREHGVPAALVEAGGDLSCYGDRTWRVGVQDPRGDGLLGVIAVSGAGVCGSGDYYQYALEEENGKERRKHHILDPSLLDSADKSIAVTVVAPSAELADALATTLFIMGPKAGEALLENYKDCAALWVLPDRSTAASRNFPALSTP